MWQELFIALSLVLIIEGIFPFISPTIWREAVISIARSSNKQIRLVGLLSMLSGVVMLYWGH